MKTAPYILLSTFILLSIQAAEKETLSKPIFTVKGKPRLALTRDKQRLIIATGGLLSIRSIYTRETIRELQQGFAITDVQVNSEVDTLYCCRKTRNSFDCIDIQTQQILHSYALKQPPYADPEPFAASITDNQAFIGAGNGALFQIDVRSNNAQVHSDPHWPITAVAYAAAGDKVLCGYSSPDTDDCMGSINAFDCRQQKFIELHRSHSRTLPLRINSVVIAPDGSYGFSSGEDVVRRWQLNDTPQEQQLTFEPGYKLLGQRKFYYATKLALANHTLCIADHMGNLSWRHADTERLLRSTILSFPTDNIVVSSLVLSADATTTALATSDGNIFGPQPGVLE